MASLIALPVQIPSPAEITSHDGDTDGRGQFWKLPSSRARALLPSRATSSPLKVPEAVQKRSEFQPLPCVPSGPEKRPPSCDAIVNEPRQPSQFSMFPVSRLRNTVAPDARHRPVSDGKSWVATTTGADGFAGVKLMADGPVGVPPTSRQAGNIAVAAITTKSQLRVRTPGEVQRPYPGERRLGYLRFPLMIPASLAPASDIRSRDRFRAFIRYSPFISDFDPLTKIGAT